MSSASNVGEVPIKETMAVPAPAAAAESEGQVQSKLLVKQKKRGSKEKKENTDGSNIDKSIENLTKEVYDGSTSLKPEEINNPFSKEYNILLFKKELLEHLSIKKHDELTAKQNKSASGESASGESGSGSGSASGSGSGSDSESGAPNYYQHLYPSLNDPEFNMKIALRKEFFDTKMDVDNDEDVEKKAEMMCNAEFELAPNQQFVRNFLSVETPYNSLLLYHGLGTGKTCSAISVAEEMRDYMKQMGITQQIIVIASPNVQENFRLQLFDERELKEIEPGIWNIRACTGNKFIKEINPMHMKGLTRERVIKQIKRLINSYYLFFGYNEFANYVRNNASSTGISSDDIAIDEIRKSRKKNELKGSLGTNAAANKKDVGPAKRGRKSAETIAKQAAIEAASIENLSVVKLKKIFANTLIIIDEVHNIRVTDDNKDKRVSKILYQIVTKVNNVRLLLLSGTPMYNSYKEIIWLINLMNINDKRSTIDISDVFDEKGNFLLDKNGKRVGEELLIRKATGYLSFVRGENPYTFPYRVFPAEHSPEFSLLKQTNDDEGAPIRQYPRRQMNGRHIDQPIKHIDVYMTNVGAIQEVAYKYIVSDMKSNYIFKKTAAVRRKAIAAAAASASAALDVEDVEHTGSAAAAADAASKKSKSKPGAAKGGVTLIDDAIVIDSENFPSFENMDTIGYAAVQRPLEALNIVYPHPSLFEHISDNTQEVEIASCIGKEGLRNIMSYTESGNPPMRREFEYRPEFIRNFKLPKLYDSDGNELAASNSSTSYRIFAPNNIGLYSSKIKNICDKVVSSDGIILIYSQYIDGGVVPIALALEELGFTRYSASTNNSSFFRTKPVPNIDAITFLQQKQHAVQFPTLPFRPARYSVITGDPSISPDNLFELKALTNEDNINGEKVKVVIISVAGAEGLDFKNIRQVHILEPWYNMNLLEQIIGRAIRNCSHKRLPYSERNVELYLYGTYLSTADVEAIDLYLYRLSEFKAVKIGIVSRALRESAVDCLLNIQHNTQTAAQLNRTVNQKLSSRKKIEYQIGARPYTALCDYMERCDYVCRPTFSNGAQIQDQEDLYGLSSDDSIDEGGNDSNDDEIEKPRGNVRVDTFNEKFMSMNIDKIIHKIRNQFKESFFYRKIDIIADINATRHYPLSQVNLALTQMVTDPNEYVHDKYGRIGHVVNIGNYYMFQPIELTDIRSSIHDRSVPIPYKHETVNYRLPKELTEDHTGITKTVLKNTVVPATMSGKSNIDEVVKDTERMLQNMENTQPLETGATGATGESSEVTSNPESSEIKEKNENDRAVEEMLIDLNNTYEECNRIYEKPNKEQEDKWYCYCGKVLRYMQQISELRISDEQKHDLIIENIVEYLHFNGTFQLVNYLYRKNNNSMFVKKSTGAVVTMVQPLSQFEQKLLSYYSQQLLRRQLSGRRAAAAAATSGASGSSGASASATVPEDYGLLVFNEKKPNDYELIILKYESDQWIVSEHEDRRDFNALITSRLSYNTRNISDIVGFITFFKNKYLIFKMKMMKKKRDKGARCDQSGKADTIALLNSLLAMNSDIDIDEHKLTAENTSTRTQRELCVFQEFILRLFNATRVNGKKWFFSPGDALLCDIERLH